LTRIKEGCSSATERRALLVHLVLDSACPFEFAGEQTVTAWQAEIPGLGDTVAFDVKHLSARVNENNERATNSKAILTARWASNAAPQMSKRCAGVAATTTPDDGDAVWAEDTQPFNEADVTSFPSFVSANGARPPAIPHACHR
jgi:predicted DsbA family dithiol-disulfide isomerase